MSDYDDFGRLFGRMVRFKRGLEGLTQEQLAVRAFGDPMGKARISQLENGRIAKPHQRTVDALAIALSIDPSEIDEIRPRLSDQFSDVTSLHVEVLENLGKVLVSLGTTQNERAPLEEALASYREALSKISREDKPVEWARLQNEIGSTLYALGSLTDDRRALDDAVAAFRRALEVMEAQKARTK